MTNVRTQTELSSANFNYFIVLKLGADTTNIKTIENAITEGIRSSTDDGAYGERLKALIPDMTEVMVCDATYDPEKEAYTPNTGARKREAEAAKRFKLGEMMELVKNICRSNGMMYKSALQQLSNNANMAAKYYSFQELEKEFLAWNTGNTVKYIDDVSGVKIPFAAFDSSTELLRQGSLKKDNLYEFLEVSANATPQEIEQAKRNKYDEYMSKAGKASLSQGRKLCGYVEEILLVPEQRKQYDYYIKLREKVWRQFALRKKYGATLITPDELYSFANIIKDTLKLDVDTIEIMLGAGLKAYGLVVAGGDKEIPELKELEKRVKLSETMELVKNICRSNGMMYKSTLQQLSNNANMAAKYYSFQELEKEFLAWNTGNAIKYIDDVSGVKISFKDFDSSTELLRQGSLKKDNLYEFLEVSANASPQEIEQAKGNKYKEYMSERDRSLRTQGKKLCGYVEEILLVPEQRKQYDYYIKLRENVWRQFALRKKYGAQSITLNEFYGFANIIKDTLKLDVDTIEIMLGAGLKAYGLVVAGGKIDRR